MNNPLSLDDVRAAFPKLGLAVYAYEPSRPVTLEVHAADGQTFSFTGATLAAVLTRAFPSLAQPAPEPPTPEQPHNVFD
jgi:hypothetical protein